MKEQPLKAELLSRLTKNQLSDSEREEFLQWLSGQTPDYQKAFLNAHLTTLGKLHSSADLPIPAFQILKDRIQKKANSTKQIRLWIGRVAAVLIPFAIYFLALRQEIKDPIPLNKQPAQLTSIKILNVKNTGSINYSLLLGDKSEVILEPGATLSYPEKFNSTKREMALTGKAFFKVRHEKLRAFIVKSTDLSIVVLGTSFWVDASSKSMKTTVKVKTGKVGVQHRTQGTLYLLPGETAIYSKKSGKLNKISPKHTDPLTIDFHPTTALSFNGTPIKNVFEELSINYKVNIKLDPGIDTTLKVSLNTRGKSISTILKEITNQHPITYKMTTKSIYIKPNK
ncbi:anti-FecI sigma factor, FecR [Arcticibacter svalbardensis MN12-7]|uniref:Anti-FecI sigma factor, FecR n=1 Tax=Arcticibacter svalbardensis MN12-7 TaxID=1150600 RepID=R9H5E5_9SPHI|nr:FecR family protein [Arcticibacter svalbardensis]EOR96399.1 anti-FecI sigma factor, FecR [Arcticibacter svalbardensis MN12-7]